MSTTTVSGIGQLATDSEAVSGTASTPILALFVTPSNLAAVFAAPPATGGTTPAAGTFTTLHATGLITGDASATISTGATALSLGTDVSTGPINIKKLERFALLANDIPGATIKTLIEPSDTASGASNLIFIINIELL